MYFGGGKFVFVKGVAYQKPRVGKIPLQGKSVHRHFQPNVWIRNIVGNVNRACLLQPVKRLLQVSHLDARLYVARLESLFVLGQLRGYLVPNRLDPMSQPSAELVYVLAVYAKDFAFGSVHKLKVV